MHNSVQSHGIGGFMNMLKKIIILGDGKTVKGF